MPKFDVDAEMIRKLATLLTETDLNEIEYAEGERRIRLTRAVPVTAPVAQLPVMAAPAPQTAPTAPAAAAVAGNTITSPMVGTVYLAPEPGAASFVKVGDRVKAGDTLLIIEAMKVMNPIKANVAGVVREILVADASPVEFGEGLLVIE